MYAKSLTWALLLLRAKSLRATRRTATIGRCTRRRRATSPPRHRFVNATRLSTESAHHEAIDVLTQTKITGRGCRPVARDPPQGLYRTAPARSSRRRLVLCDRSEYFVLKVAFGDAALSPLVVTLGGNFRTRHVTVTGMPSSWRKGSLYRCIGYFEV